MPGAERSSWKIIVKHIQRYTNKAGNVTTKANVDLDLAVDAMHQADRRITDRRSKPPRASRLARDGRLAGARYAVSAQRRG